MDAPRRGSTGRRGDAPPPAPSPLDCLEARYLAEARPGHGLPSPVRPEIAFAGRSNAGKSTLLNRIAQRRALARTSKTPGCTRGVVLFELRLRDGSVLHVADLPGYGFADRSRKERARWGVHLEEYVARRASLRVVVVLIDSRRGPQPDDVQLLEWLAHIRRTPVVALTKIDKLSRNEARAAVESARRELGVPVLGVSGETGEGREELLRRVRALALPEEAHTGTNTASDAGPKGAESPPAEADGTAAAQPLSPNA